MPVPASIAAAAAEFHTNTGFLERVTSGIEPGQWLSRPHANSNHIAWIAGHLVWARQALIGRLGGEWAHPGLEIFARSAKIDSSVVYPSPEALLAAWREAAGVLDKAMETVSDAALDAPAPPGPPSPNGKLSGMVGVLAWHETYHLGQIAYLRSWLGCPGIFG